MYSVTGSVANVAAGMNAIPMLNGSNFKAWQEKVHIVLGVMDLDLALRIDKPADINDESTSEQKRELEQWERSNRISLMIMKHAIPEAFRGSMTDEAATAKGFLADLEKRFAKSKKTEASTLLAKLISMKYKGTGNIREYILEMHNIVSKLSALKLQISEDLLVHLVLISLPAQFS